LENVNANFEATDRATLKIPELATTQWDKRDEGVIACGLDVSLEGP